MADEYFMSGDLSATVRVQDLPASREVVAVERQENGTWRVCGSAIANTDGIAELGLKGSNTSRVYAFAIDHWGEPFTPNKTVAYGDIIRPSVFLGWLYRVTAPGTLPDEEPVWWNSTPGMPRPVGSAMAQAEMYFQPIAHGPVDIEWEDKGVGDPHWDKVVALLHFDGDFTDESGLGTYTKSGAVSFSSDGHFGECVALNTGTTTYITTDNLGAWHLGDQDFTIEMYLNLTKPLANQESLMSIYRDVSGENTVSTFIWAYSSVSGLIFDFRAGNTYIAGPRYVGAIPVDEWAHLAVTREGPVFRMFLNGVLVAISMSTATLNYPGTPLKIGGGDAGGGYNSFQGRMDELRVTIGVARYTENFTPPTEPFPNFK